MLLFYIIIGIIVFEFILENLLEIINLNYQKKPLPKILKDVFSEENYLKQKNYESANTRFSMLTSTFSLILILFMFISGGFGILDTWIRHYFENSIIISLIFFGIIGILFDLITIPFQLYHTFIIEEKFGFNKMTGKTFWLDKLKQWALSVIIGGFLLTIVLLFYRYTENQFWIYAWILVAVFSVFMNMFYSTLIVPLFNKQTPLQEGDLRNGIHEFCQKAGFALQEVFIIDGSKRSAKANAYFAGLGKKRRIVIYDTLMNQLSNQEVVAVLAHEVGHYKLKHIYKNLAGSIIQTGIVLFLFSLIVSIPQFSIALGATQASFHIALLTFGILLSPAMTLLNLVTNYISRQNEFKADAYAASYTLAPYLISGLKKLTEKNLGNLMPHPAYVLFHYSHPPLFYRIQNLTIDQVPA